MPRFFNTAGPCNPARHYMVPVAERLPELRRLIEQQLYFVLHAPRQVGKTTTLRQLAETLTAEGTYAAAVLSMEAGAAFPDDIGQAEQTVLQAWNAKIAKQLPAELHPLAPWPQVTAGGRIAAALTSWSQACPRPLVVFLDEIDALQDNVLLSVLRQLRDGYDNRPELFPWSLGLIGLRDVRDYKVKSGGSASLHTASPFNVKAESLTLGNFTRDEVAALLQQHTVATGQVFLPEALDRMFFWSQGQPWLVNALARQCVERLVPDPKEAVTAAHMEEAKQVLVQRQDAHLDSLAERLREPRVAAVMQVVLAGSTLPDLPEDDLRYVVDLGLLRISPQGALQMANPLYEELIPRSLSRTLLLSVAGQLPTPTWLTATGQLDPARLLEAFLGFWRQHGEPLMRSAPYHEAAPHLVMLAFLDRVANGGGHVEREYAVGSGRMDVLVTHGAVRMAMELKVWRPGGKDPLGQGLGQLDGYLAGLGLERGWLVIFDRRADLPPLDERVTTENATTPSGRTVVVVRA